MRIAAEIHCRDFTFRFVARKWKGDEDRAATNYYQLGITVLNFLEKSWMKSLELESS